MAALLSGWGLTLEPRKFESVLPDIDLDDLEDFQLTRAENREWFGPAFSKQAIDQAIVNRFPEKVRMRGLLVCSAHGVMPEALLS